MIKVKLLDYTNSPKWVEIPEDTKEVVIEIVSGDMVMTKPFFADSSNDRTLNFYDGSFIIPSDKFDKLNELKNSYDLFNL